MNLAQSFTPARPIAQHCPELTERGPRPEERAEAFASWRRDLARELSQEMTTLLAGSKLDVAIAEPDMVHGADVFKRVGGVAANCLLRFGEPDQQALLSCSNETVVALTDRGFGGNGELPSDPVSSLPHSAALMIEQIARTVASVIARVSALDDGSGETESDTIIRDDLARLRPFTPSTPCALFTIELLAGDGVSWSGLLAMSSAKLDGLLAGITSPQPANDDDESDGRLDAAVFGQVPLPLEAVLAEFELSLGQLDRLAPGDEIPITIARDIPLRIGARMVACGSLGTMEDRMALKVTAVPSVPSVGCAARGAMEASKPSAPISLRQGRQA